MKYPFKSLLLAATVLAAASCAKDDTQSGGEETAGPVIVNASPAAIGGEIILKLKTEASGIVEKSRAQGVSKGSGIDEIDRILNTVNTVMFRTALPGRRAFRRTHPQGRPALSGITPNTTRRSRRARWPACSPRARTSKSSNTRWPPKLRTTAARHLPPDRGCRASTRAISRRGAQHPVPFNESERSQQMQWHYNNTGNIFAQTSQLGADANVYAAWQLSTGNPDVIVAVVDQGVKYDHEDSGRQHVGQHERELPGQRRRRRRQRLRRRHLRVQLHQRDGRAGLLGRTRCTAPHVAGTIAAVTTTASASAASQAARAGATA
ncbi:MAG: hypothetical protein ACLU9X_10730 [Alistipes shahii]